MRAFFRRHPRIHATIHWCALCAGAVVLVQDKILGASALFPADSVIPRYIAYGLGAFAFSNILLGAAAQITDPAAAQAAAPVGAISASEAITAVDKPGAVQKTE